MKTEHELKQLLQEGSHRAFEHIFRQYHGDLFRYSLAILRDEDEAKEVAQRCFMRLWEKRGEAASIESLHSYLIRSAHNICVNKHEHHKVKERYASEEGYLLRHEFIAEFDNTCDEQLAAKLRVAAEELPAKNREVFKLRYFSGMDTEEVSEILGITPRTVETHVSNAFRMLREILKPTLMIIIFIFCR